MRVYELTCLISSNLSDETLKNLSQKIQSLIQERGGILIDCKNPLRKKLGYPVKKEGMAFISTLNFHFEPEKLGNLEKKLKELPGILRFLIAEKRIEKVKVLREKIKPKIEKIPKPLPKVEKKVELEDIEKNLEEILGEI
jgi:ribosomal protein S6